MRRAKILKRKRRNFFLRIFKGDNYEVDFQCWNCRAVNNILETKSKEGIDKCSCCGKFNYLI